MPSPALSPHDPGQMGPCLGGAGGHTCGPACGSLSALWPWVGHFPSLPTY